MGMALFAFLLLALTLGLAEPRVAGSEICKRPVDAVVILELPNEGSSVKVFGDFFRKLVAGIAPRKNCVRLSFIASSNKPHLLTTLNCNFVKDGCFYEAFKKIASLQPLLNQTVGFDASKNKRALLKAINLGKIQLSLNDNGARRGIKKSMVLVLSNPPVKGVTATQKAVRDVQEKQIELIAIGIDGEKKEKLEEIVVVQDLLMYIDTFSDLVEKSSIWTIALLIKSDASYETNYSKKQLNQSSIKEETKPVANATVDKKCENIVDIGFLLDSSNSIRDDYQREKLFIEKLATRFGISKEGSHAGVIVFSAEQQVKTLIRLDQFYDIDEFRKEVASLPFYGSVTRIDLALKEASDWLFTKEAGARKSVKKLLFLITDGRQNPYHKDGKDLNPAAHAKPLHDRNVPIYAIGIGNRINKTELDLISRSSKNVYTVDNFEQLLDDAFVKLVSEQSCTFLYREPQLEAKNSGAQKPEEQETGKSFEVKPDNGTERVNISSDQGEIPKNETSKTNEKCKGQNNEDMTTMNGGESSQGNATKEAGKDKCQRKKQDELGNCGKCCNERRPVYVNIYNGGNNFIIQNKESKDIKVPESYSVENQVTPQSTERTSSSAAKQMTANEIASFIQSLSCGSKIDRDAMELLQKVLSSCKKSKDNK